ncbi:hypothetical protein H0H93_000154 [Arthromyces matolae]|nr:hypothetical protein H0H93_000154 [Arthromyces matolae]
MGVKSLWSLLTPIGRPVLLETVEGKTMAIDSSIWLYQFQATMRDKDGRVLVNAHVLGFLRRISKLLFYGIKPVFVFDGGAPILKKDTLRARKEKKSGAAASHVKLAEKILAAQMRREALNQASGSSKRKKQPAHIVDDDNTVYLEDIETTAPKAPTKKQPPTPASASKKPKFYDHDPYKLPDVDMEAAVAKARAITAPDPRLATEDELREFIDEMRPEDFDVTSPAFRDLPTEVQYEIVGDLRLKSRQTSYARLQNMLRNAPTPMDFSKQQIKNLQQRNSLTQQLMVTTNTIGSAHISIPVRIASERNKEYVLMKNEGVDGGWILGIRDHGTKEKPIEIDQDDVKVVDEDSDEDMEEVPIAAPSVPDADLREYQRSMAVSAIDTRLGARQRRIERVKSKKPLFALDDDDELLQDIPLEPRRNSDQDDDDDDDLLAIAIQESLEQGRPSSPLSGPSPKEASSSKPSIHSTPIRSHKSLLHRFNDDDFMLESPSRLEAALTFANAGPSRSPLFSVEQRNQAHGVFGRSTLLSASSSDLATWSSQNARTTQTAPTPTKSGSVLEHSKSVPHMTTAIVDNSSAVAYLEKEISGLQQTRSLSSAAAVTEQDDEDDLEEINVPSGQMLPHEGPVSPVRPAVSTPTKTSSVANITPRETREVARMSESIAFTPDVPPSLPQSSVGYETPPKEPLFDVSFEDEEIIPWSRSASPSEHIPFVASRPRSPARNADFDAVQEMDLHAEEGDYARFISQVKGKNIDDVRRELDEEIKSLNQQRKAAMRDSEDITQQMISQIMVMLRLFGIPYITAPMEAEAQCAELVSLGLVDGVITDDSDIFLFGGQRVYKNMFNQSKTVECFLLKDLSRDLGLERETLIQLAYLLGSDYTDGLPGVGPVVAMELLKEFPGESGLVNFRNWWIKVQSGKDKEEDNKSTFRKQFKKRFKNLYLTSDWPNPAVRDAYYRPTVDSSDEPFKWGMPDLDALRAYFHQELGWSQAKVDETILPIIQKMNKRGQSSATNRQGNLIEFLDVSGGSGTLAPKKRQVYTSKRLQNVVDDFRLKRVRRSSGSPGPEQHQSDNEESQPSPAKKRAKTKNSAKKPGNEDAKAKASSTSLRKPRARKRVLEEESDHEDSEDGAAADEVFIPPDPLMVARLRPRPKLKRNNVIERNPDIVTE